MTEAASGGPATDRGAPAVPGRQPPPPDAPAVPGGQPPPPDAPQQFGTATSYLVRDALQEFLERDLLGPWDGEDEVLPPRSQGPGERYLVGRLGPRHEPGSAEERVQEAATVDADVAAGGDGADPELPDLLTVQNAGRMWASSMGLSCVVAPGVDILTVTVAWGQYVKSDILDDAGNPHRQWSQAAGQAGDTRPAQRGPVQEIPADRAGCVPGGGGPPARRR